MSASGFSVAATDDQVFWRRRRRLCRVKKWRMFTTCRRTVVLLRTMEMFCVRQRILNSLSWSQFKRTSPIRELSRKDFLRYWSLKRALRLDGRITPRCLRQPKWPPARTYTTVSAVGERQSYWRARTKQMQQTKATTLNTTQTSTYTTDSTERLTAAFSATVATGSTKPAID